MSYRKSVILSTAKNQKSLYARVYTCVRTREKEGDKLFLFLNSLSTNVLPSIFLLPTFFNW